MKSFGNGTSTSEGGPCGYGSGSCVGISNVFKYMKTLLPGGDVLFTFDTGMYGMTTRGLAVPAADNLFLQSG
jgi:peptidoglycan/xylan/chitin deacetylase (PgdA/CDA1 family)